MLNVQVLQYLLSLVRQKHNVHNGTYCHLYVQYTLNIVYYSRRLIALSVNICKYGTCTSTCTSTLYHACTRNNL